MHDAIRSPSCCCRAAWAVCGAAGGVASRAIGRGVHASRSWRSFRQGSPWSLALSPGVRLEQEVDAGLSHLRPALIDTTGQQAWAEAAVTHLSGRQAIRQWLEMALVVPQSTRAVILCHQRLAWASLAHTRLPGQPPPHRRGRPAAAAPLLLPTDLVEQVAESLPPECRQFARFEVCWQLLIDRRHAWTPETRACE